MSCVEWALYYLQWRMKYERKAVGLMEKVEVVGPCRCPNCTISAYWTKDVKASGLLTSHKLQESQTLSKETWSKSRNQLGSFGQ